MKSVESIATAARAASYELASSSGAKREACLFAMAAAIRAHSPGILAANQLDLRAAQASGTAGHMLDRLALDEKRVEAMATALVEVAGLPDPIGRIDSMWTRPNGLRVGRRRIPLGVIGIIYEARPNVTSDAAALCVKSGNAVVLKGGSEALHSNQAIAMALQEGLAQGGLPAEVVGFIDSSERSAVNEMLVLDEQIDVIIPRGGEGLIRFVSEHAKMPVIKHYKGVCHVYVDASAELEMATNILVNAKVQRPSVCNAAETLLVHRDAATLLAPIAEALIEHGVTLHVCPRSHALLANHAYCVEATESDWGQEYLSLDLSVKIVDSMDEAIAHIRRYGSLHTEAIVTNDYRRAERFLERVDSSTVLVNASTRFADGGELGLGAEIGISTTKLHAFGPMGLDELTTTKIVVYGNGQVRS